MDGDRNGYASYKVADDVTDGNVEQIRSPLRTGASPKGVPLLRHGH